MRLVVLAVVLAAGDARAGTFVQDWVGTWTGPATWKGCTAAGADSLTVAITWHDDALWIDGAAIYDGLGDLAPEVRDDGSLGYGDGYLTVSFKKSKKKGVVLTLTTAAQCTMTARIARPTTGIDACDGLVALAAAAASCQVTVDDDPSADLDTWRALTTAKQRRGAAAQCTTRAAALTQTLVAQDCVPPEHDPAAAPECREVWRLVDRIDRCEQAPATFKQATHEHASNLRKQVRSLTVDSAIPYCQESADVLRESAEELHCQL